MKKRLINIFRLIYQLIPGKIYVFRLLRLIYHPSDFMINQLYFKGSFTVKFKDFSFKMKCHNRRGFTIENRLFWNGNTKKQQWESQSIHLWAKIAGRSDIIFDIGANTGFYSLLAKAANASCTVFGFEPVYHIYEWYKQNCILNNFEVLHYNMALSDKSGTEKIYMPDTKQNIYSASLDEGFAESHASRKTIVYNTVPVTTIEEFILSQKIDKIDLIKIDVEGCELKVIKGMGEYLKLFKPTILIEVLSRKIGDELTKILKPMNYLFFNLNQNDKPILSDSITVSNDFNFFICQKVVAESLELI